MDFEKNQPHQVNKNVRRCPKWCKECSSLTHKCSKNWVKASKRVQSRNVQERTSARILSNVSRRKISDSHLANSAGQTFISFSSFSTQTIRDRGKRGKRGEREGVGKQKHLTHSKNGKELFVKDNCCWDHRPNQSKRTGK